MGQLVDGKWTNDPYVYDEKGRFLRNATVFHDWVSDDGSTPFTAEANRYHLYVSWACPWAHRTLIVRTLRKLENAISLSVVDSFMGDEGWWFSDNPGAIPDSVNGASHLWQVYVRADPKHTGRVTVPVLWDKKTGTIVNNESRQILRMLDTSFRALGDPDVSFYSAELADRIEHTIDAIYEPINNGVYRAGFAGSQEAYYEAVTEVFEALDYWDEVLSGQRYLCGEVITEADWCLFTTLLRFDPVYAVHFKCNVRRIVEYPNLSNYLRELYQVPGVAQTCNFDHIKNHYYQSHRSLNPKGIVPKGPLMALGAPHNRGRLPARAR